MSLQKKLYPTFFNPFLINPERPLPDEMAVIGAGSIGPDIGYYLRNALPDKRLYLVDIAEAPLKNAEKRFNAYAQKAIARKKLREDQAQAVLKNVVYTTDYAQMKNCTLVIEAATENLDLKQKIFERVEEIVGEDAIITSNTSSIPADRAFAKMKRPERCTITHFFAPAWFSMGIEVVNWEKTSREVLDYLFWFFAQTGKAPVITDNVICFMLNRIFENWVNEGGYLLDQATAAQICSVAEEFVLQGPFYVVNMGNGNPIIVEANTRKMAEGKHYRPVPIFRSVEKWAVPRPGTRVDIAEETRNRVRDRLLGIFFSQSFDIVDRGIGRAEDLNFGCQVALGFKKGPFDVMRNLGEKEVTRITRTFNKDRPGFPQPQKDISAYQDFRRFLLVDDMDGVKILTIRRPQAMNAISNEINDEILAVLKENMNNPQVKGFVLTGYGHRAFSAGADIGQFPASLGNKEAATNLARNGAKLLTYLDRMEKPIVAAVNGMALGGGLETAIRCHSIVAARNATFQLPEITLGISPGVGGAVVPYRRWPQGAALFHEMICLARKIGVQEAADVGMVARIEDDYPAMIQAAVEEVNRLHGKVVGIPDGKVDIPKIAIPDPPMAGKLGLSKEALSIVARIIQDAAAADTLQEALEIGYLGAGEIACTDAAREGITAFLEKREPRFTR
ncbi:MAG: enoyl-CoA hydratase/isomerase family protein [Proteobacteria bacterium]|nr:enoyl-CoA hydratase/isomerase family protein [Pseudomonadota bacterium]